jgi:DNA-binding MarR family transcriptional regulator/AcrR family transcriptional regulator
MAASTVRADAIVRRIAGLDADTGRLEAVALGLVDSVLEADREDLAAALDALRDARARVDGQTELAGWLDAAIAFAHWGLERAPSAGAAVAQGTQAHDFLRVLSGQPQLGSTELRRQLDVDETQVSRTGRRLLETGLVTRRKVGRQVFWQLTPRGQRALEEAPAPRRVLSHEFWREAIRRGFEAASGDEPGEPRTVDPTRERIIESSLELHRTQGIKATTWSEIAAKAAVPMDTVTAFFPTPDDLYRSCGAHLIESLVLPPLERMPELFAGASDEHDRVHRLVETFFGVYERGADAITAGRREGKELPAVNESVEAIDETFDALAAEALRPLHADGASLTSVRALTDLEVWRTLRDQGASPDAAVEQASLAVERWLDAHAAH